MMATARQTDTVRLASLLAGNARVPPDYLDRLWLTTLDYVFALHERVPR